MRLSDMLAAARDIESDDGETEDLPLLLVVRVLAMATQEIGAARRHHDPSVLLAFDDGTTLSDLVLVTRAVLLSTPAGAAEADDATDTPPASDGAPAQHPDDQDPQVEISA